MERKLGEMPRHEEIVAIEMAARRMRAEFVRDATLRLGRWLAAALGGSRRPAGTAKA